MPHLTQRDVDNFGYDLVDLAQRAARHAIEPQLQQLEQQNDELQDHLAREMQRDLHQEVVRAVPNWNEINNDPRWLQWLNTPDVYNGCTRQRLLNDAVAAGNAGRVIAIFKGFLREQGAAGQAPAGQASQRTQRTRRTLSGLPVYTRSQIIQMWAMRRKGEIGDEEWARWEHELVAAGREGRIIGALNADGIPVSR
jgi:hypothetical protein